MEIRIVSRDEMNLQTRGRKPKASNVKRYAEIEKMVNGETTEVRIYANSMKAFRTLRVFLYRNYGKSSMKTRTEKAKQPGYYMVITKR